MLFKLSLQSIIYRKKQYTSLLIVCILGIAISLTTLFTVNGMMISLKNKARIYYGGDYQFLTGKKPNKFQDQLMDTKADKTIEKLTEIFPANSLITMRVDLDFQKAAFYFDGESIPQRVIKGIDFEKESKLFDTLNFAQGTYKSIEKNSNGILISEPIATKYNIKPGDKLTLSFKDLNLNTDTFIAEVKGIFIDSSLFGMYTTYIDLSTLQSIFKISKNTANRICITLPSNFNDKTSINEYQSNLEKEFNMHPLVKDKNIFYKKVLKEKSKTSILIPLDINLLDLKIVIEAMRLISLCLIFSLAVIIIVGISCTFRVIIMKRINEIGIYKAIGTHKKDISQMLFYETTIVMLTGFICGFILSGIICLVISKISLSFIPAFDVFLTNGCIIPKFSLLYTLGLILVLSICTIIAVFLAIKKPVQVMPCTALSVTE